MTMPFIVSFHTPDPIYQAAANRLRASLEKFNLAHEIVSVNPRGNWNINCCYKANFVHAMFRAYDPLDLVWMDADAEVMRYPALFADLDCDVSAVVNKHGLLAGLVYFRRGPGVERLLEDWVVLNQQEPNGSTPDQTNLARLLEKNDYNLKFQELPWEYSYIPGIMGTIEDPVILQHQASRQGRGYYL